jgi:hypothetical protein
MPGKPHAAPSQCAWEKKPYGKAYRRADEAKEQKGLKELLHHTSC